MSWMNRLLNKDSKFSREEALENSYLKVREGLLLFFGKRASKWKLALDAIARSEGVDPKYVAYTMLQEKFWPREVRTTKMRFARRLLASQGLLETFGMRIPLDEEAVESALLRFSKGLEAVAGDVQNHYMHKVVMPEARKYKASLRREKSRGSLLNDAAAQISGYFKGMARHDTSSDRLLVLDALEAFDL